LSDALHSELSVGQLYSKCVSKFHYSKGYTKEEIFLAIRNLEQEGWIISERRRTKLEILNDDNYKKMIEFKERQEAFHNQGDTASAKKMHEKIKELDLKTNEFRNKIRAENPDLFFSKVLKAMDEPGFREKQENETDSAFYHNQYIFYQYHFFDNIDFSDDRMLRTPLLQEKLDKYIERITMKHPDSLKYAAERAIELSKANDEMFKFVLSNLFYKYANSKFMGMDVVFVHLAFVLFAVLGAVLILWRRWILWIHLPSVFWAIWIELSAGICPLTPLENWLRTLAGQGGYRGAFVAHYLVPVLYPAGLTRNIQFLLGLSVIIINTFIYGYVIFRFRRVK